MDNKLLPGDIFGNAPKNRENKKEEFKADSGKKAPSKKPAKAVIAKKPKKVKIESVEKLIDAAPPVKKSKPAKTTKAKPAAAKKHPEEKAASAPKPKFAAKSKPTAKIGSPVEREEPATRTADEMAPDANEIRRKLEKNKTEQMEDGSESVGDFPWEYPDGEVPQIPCDSCGEPIHPDSKVCIHCGSSFVLCPHCRRQCAALYDPKMATEQRLNRIFKQYTLFSIALPSLPLQPILDCSCCHERMILCEACRTTMPVNEDSCPKCGFRVRRTKLIMSPLGIIESIFKKPDVSRSIQRAVENFLRSLSEW